MSKRNETVSYLDCSSWSLEWEQLLEKASPSYPRLGVQTMHMVLPIPGRKTTLVFHDNNQCYQSTFRTLTTLLRKQESGTFYNYHLTCHVLSRLKGFQKRRLPMINSNFVLFPLTSPKNAIWLNPLSMDRVWEEPERTFIKMATGPGLLVKTSKRTLNKYAGNALLGLATSKRDLSWVTGLSPHLQPLDYLDLPDTPFVNQLIHQEIFKDFPIEYQEFYQYYSFQQVIAQILEKYPAIDLGDLRL